MKPLNIHELRTFAQNLTEMLNGSQLQEIYVNDRGLALGFYKKNMNWLIIDLVQPSPMLLCFTNHLPFRKSSQTKPVSLFLRSHGKNLIFQSCQVLEQWGRVVLLTLSNSQKICEIEVQLIPKQVNLIVRLHDVAQVDDHGNRKVISKSINKTVSWDKPREMKPAGEVPEMTERSWQAIHDEWLKEQQEPQVSSLDPVAKWEKQRQNDLQKKQKALSEIEKILNEDKSIQWFAVGEHLKTFAFKDLPSEWESLIDRKNSMSWNIENVFYKAKQFEQKKAGTLLRSQKLAAEIKALEVATFKNKMVKGKLDDLMAKTEVRGRKLNLPSGAIAYCGRSGADNLALLRQAKAWDFWLHLKDYPGAHGIVHRQRDQNISDKELLQVGEWVAQESLASRSLMLGQRLDFVIVECRFVKPIKGDKLGRVTYHSERTMTCQYGSQKS